VVAYEKATPEPTDLARHREGSEPHLALFSHISMSAEGRLP
jgi:hypothetical protein